MTDAGDDGAGSDPDGAQQFGAALGPRIRFSSDELDSGLSDEARRKLWYELYTSRYGKVDIDWGTEGPFRAESEFVPIDDVIVGRFDLTFSRVTRTRSHVAEDRREDLLIGFAKNAMLRADLHGRDVLVRPGSVVFYTKAQPAEFHSAARVAGISLALPAREFQDSVASIHDRIGRLLDPANPAVVMLGRYLELVLASEAQMSGLLHDHMRRTLVDLAALAIGAKRDAEHLGAERGLRAARLAAIKAEIRANVGQRDLSVAAIAKRHGVTPRYVHLLFEAEAKSFMEYVTAERLAAAHRMLIGSSYGHLRISEIAFAVGFSDLSTFNRQFRRVYGGTPSEIRAAARQAW